VAFSVGTVALTARLADRLWARAEQPGAARLAAISAAALLAVNPVHMVWSQVIRSDVMGTLFLLLCLVACTDIAERGRRGDWIRAAGWLALATATKWPFALGALCLVASGGLRVWRGASVKRTLVALGLTGSLALLFLVAVSPYLVLAWPTVIANVAGEAQQQHLGATGGGPLENLSWYGRGPILSGLGEVGLVLVALGLWRARRNGIAFAILAPLVLGFTAAMAFQHIVWERWALPVMPALAILGGAGVAHLADSWRGRPGRGAALAAAVLALTAVPLAIQCWQRGTEHLDDTRQQATRWARTHIPDGDTILIEHFGFDLLSRNWGFRFPLGDRGCVDARELLAGKLQYGLIAQGRGSRSNVDYGTLNPLTRQTCTAEWAILTQADRYAAEATRFPHEADAYWALIASGRQVAIFAPMAGKSSGPVVRIIDFRR